MAMPNTNDANWYELFSRGARDWLRHNEKVREAVRGHLPELFSVPDLMTGPEQRNIQVPVRVLEHARFRLSEGRSTRGAGQGEARPGEVLRPAAPPAPGQDGGSGEGELSLLLEFSVDDILDWLWDEFKLPHMRPLSNSRSDDAEFVREGWDRRGAPARLDRRRTVKEAIKRRAMQTDPAAFTNEDLRFRQLLQRPRPNSKAVVFFVLDVSASMTQAERRLAKSFFFLALHGIRRRYRSVDTRFLAHTALAWEFAEADFFQISGSGGTVASSAFRLASQLLEDGYGGSAWNRYLFYASDGDNFTEDRAMAATALGALAKQLNFLAYIETLPGMPRSVETEMHRLFRELERQGLPVSSSVVSSNDELCLALRHFFTQQAGNTVTS